MATSFSPVATAPLHLDIARALVGDLRGAVAIDRGRLRQLFEQATERSDASGAWSMRQAYDALELAQILYILDAKCPLAAPDPRETLARLSVFAARLLVQSYRSEGQVALQQFSTPLALAFLAARAGRPERDDILLEPSAGNGLLACCAARSECRMLLNELDGDRLASLGEAFPAAQLSAHDGELIDDLLAPDLRPSLVLMNPPFARSDGRGEDRYAGARHLLAALGRLSPGGRLVAIMPESFGATGSGRELRARAGRLARQRLDALIAPGAFARHGTGVAVRLVVFDKVAVVAAEPVSIQIDALDQLIPPIDALPPRGGVDVSQPSANPLAMFRRSVAVAVTPVPRAGAGGAAGASASAVPLSYRVLEEPAAAEE